MRSSLEWKKYYQENALSLLEIPWQIGHELSEEEKLAITSSVQDFQAGESSEGRHLIQYAKAYAEQTGDHEYVEAIRVFIAEEQRHARDLAHFMQINAIPLVKTTFTDSVFRKLRQVFNGDLHWRIDHCRNHLKGLLHGTQRCNKFTGPANFMQADLAG